MDTLLMATRAGRTEHAPEAEPVLVQADLETDTVTIVLDDGDTIVLDRVELGVAIGAIRDNPWTGIANQGRAA